MRSLATLRALPHWWSLLLPVLLLGPVLARGYVLSYDMVFVPRLALRGSFLGAGTALPRAVPSDAVVAVLDNLVPGMLLQKVVLLGALVLVGQGAIRLVEDSVPAQLVAVSLAVWSPFVVERLWIGQWTVLLGYAVVPWLVVLLRHPRLSPWLAVLAPLGCLSASAGIVTGLVLLVVGVRRGAGAARTWLLAGLALACNAPWLVAGLLHAVAAAPSRVGAAVFATHGEGSVPAPLAALGLGGIWNADVVPGSRQGPFGWVALAVLLGLAWAGFRRWWTTSPEPGRLAICWVLGYAIALAGWCAPEVAEWLGTHVPGAGVLRDGSRFLALCLPLLLGTVSSGAARLTDAGTSALTPTAVGAATVVCALFPVMVMTDAAWGLGGALQPTDYPSSWARLRADLARAEAVRPGQVLLLPFSAYRAPAWNGGRVVIDPVGRYLTPDYVAADDLFVDGVRVAGDDPSGPDVRRALVRRTPAGRASGLARLGIGYVVRDASAPGAGLPGFDADVGGTVVARGGDLTVVRLDPLPEPSPGLRPAQVLAWVAFVTPWMLAGGSSVWTWWRRRRRRVTCV